ncbi:MAG: hypothetical protein E7646_09220 [Ruminococcaceae bacterium]|nr:hypothetical protein [Oscillospiraceae bacterium]
MKKIIVIISLLCLGAVLCSCSANMSFPTERMRDRIPYSHNDDDNTVYETDNNGVESYDYYADGKGRVRGFISDHNK